MEHGFRGNAPLIDTKIRQANHPLVANEYIRVSHLRLKLSVEFQKTELEFRPVVVSLGMNATNIAKASNLSPNFL